MAVIALASASGAPGVTTTAIALTLLSQRPTVLIEASPAGGSAVLAGYLRGEVAPEGRSLLGLAKAHRHGRLVDALGDESLPLDTEGSRWVVPAIAETQQAPSLAQLWAPLAEALPHIGSVDVIVDAGRLGATHGPEPLLAACDLVLLCTRTQLSAVAATRARAEALRALTGPDSTSGPDVELVVIGDGRPYTQDEISGVVGLPVLAAVSWDPVAADVLSNGSPRPRRWEQGTFIRSLGSASDAVDVRLRHRRERPVPAMTAHTSSGGISNG